MASAKEIVREILESLPDDCSVEDVVQELYAGQRAGEGDRDIDDRRLAVHGEVMRQARRYLGD